jgi:phage terminase Nu1 subunit (DNA packaging protein)
VRVTQQRAVSIAANFFTSGFPLPMKGQKKMSKTTMTAEAFGETVGLSTRSVRDLVKRGVIAKSGTGFPPEAVKKYCAHLREAAAGRGGKASSSVATERAALLKTQRERAEFEFAKAREEYVPFAEVESLSKAFLTGCRAAIMAIPDRISPSLGLDRRTFVAIKEELRVILTDLAKTEAARLGRVPDSELLEMEKKLYDEE